MTWFRRRHDDDDPAPGAPPQDDDSPDALRARRRALVQFVDRSAGGLPVEAVVSALDTLDAIGAVIDTADPAVAGEAGELDIHAVVSINGIVGDYLPTTLHAYLNLDPRLTERPGPSGRTPNAALIEQLDALSGAADDLLRATREHDLGAIFTQGSFLRTKFSRSDLDL